MHIQVIRQMIALYKILLLNGEETGRLMIVGVDAAHGVQQLPVSGIIRVNVKKGRVCPEMKFGAQFFEIRVTGCLVYGDDIFIFEPLKVNISQRRTVSEHKTALPFGAFPELFIGL